MDRAENRSSIALEMVLPQRLDDSHLQGVSGQSVCWCVPRSQGVVLAWVREALLAEITVRSHFRLPRKIRLETEYRYSFGSAVLAGNCSH